MKKIGLLFFMTFNVYAEMSQTNQVLKAESDKLVESFKSISVLEAEVIRQKNTNSINRDNPPQQKDNNIKNAMYPEVGEAQCVFEKYETYYKNYNDDILSKTKSLTDNGVGEKSVLPSIDIKVGQKTSYAISWLNNLDEIRKVEKYKKCISGKIKEPSPSVLPSCPKNINDIQEVWLHKNKIEGLYFTALSNFTSVNDCIKEVKIREVRGINYNSLDLQAPAKPEFSTKF